MAQHSISINGRSYTIACEDGQEEHLNRLAAYLGERVGELTASLGQIGDARLLVMAGLLIADELSDAYADVAAARGESLDDPLDKAAVAALRESDDATAAAQIESLAERIESIAERLEQA